MLTIRQEQMLAFQQGRQDDIVRRIRGQFDQFFPVDRELLGENAATGLVVLAIHRARAHGFATIGGAWRYLCLMVALGSHFDEDPWLPWAAERLRPETGPPDERMASLVDAALAHMDLAAGLEGERHLTALRRACAMSAGDLARFAGVPPVDALDALARTLHRHKHALAPKAVPRAVARAREHAQKLRLDTPAGGLLLAGLAFLLGSGFLEDPAHVWVLAALDSDAAPAARCDAVLAAGAARLARAEEAIALHARREG